VRLRNRGPRRIGDRAGASCALASRVR
jgi:hypothetical protein